MMKDFPSSKNFFGELNTYSKGIMSVSPAGEVYFNPDYFKTYREAYNIEAYNSCASENNFHPHGSNIRSSGYHEAGHILELTLIRKYNPNASIDEVMKLYNNSTYAAMVIKKSGAMIVSNKDFGALVEEVSGYAHKDFSECLAECVTDYYLNKGSAAALSRQVIKELRKEINV